MKKTLILGATDNPTRYANMASNRLKANGHPIVNVGLKNGEAAGVAIEKPDQIHDDIHTLTLYVGTKNQKDLIPYILKTNPKRIIFNPGTENEELELLAKENGIETIEACTLVMLSTGQY